MSDGLSQQASQPPVGGGGSGAPAGSAVLTDALPSLRVVASETNAAQSENLTALLQVLLTDTNAAQSEAMILKITGLADTNATPTEALRFTIRYAATAGADNDSSRTTPANSVGANNGTFSTVSTNLALADLTNPVILTGSAFGVPTSVSGATVTAKRLRVWWRTTSGTLGLDTSTLAYNVGAGSVSLEAVASNVAVDYFSAGKTYDVSGLTLTQLSALTLTMTYLAVVVATPQAQANVDAWAVDLDVTVP